MFNRGGRQARPPLYPSDPMNPRILSLLAACILTIGPAASQAEERPVRLHTLDEMNTAAAPLNSHAGAERYSVLESVRAYRQLLPAAKLKTDRTAIYPRIKRMADGRYILFVQGGQIASRIYYCTSDDLLHWSDTRILFEPYAVTTSRPSMPSCWPTATCSPPARSAPRRATNTTSAAESCSAEAATTEPPGPTKRSSSKAPTGNPICSSCPTDAFSATSPTACPPPAIRGPR